VPFIVFGNKIDKHGAASEEELRSNLGLTMSEVYERNRNGMRIEVFMCSVARKIGYSDGFKWLTQFLK